jgi:hypothetical protein
LHYVQSHHSIGRDHQLGIAGMGGKLKLFLFEDRATPNNLNQEKNFNLNALKILPNAT